MFRFTALLILIFISIVDMDEHDACTLAKLNDITIVYFVELKRLRRNVIQLRAMGAPVVVEKDL